MKRGFTLVELSIVLVIVGLLIGGVLVAQSMISTAQIHSTIKEVGQYQIAVRLYQEKFNALPGDDPKAYDKYGDICLSHMRLGYTYRCTEVYPATAAGDAAIDCWQNLPEQECVLAWRHLELAGLIPHPTNAMNAYSGSKMCGFTAYVFTPPTTNDSICYPSNYSVPVFKAYRNASINIINKLTWGPTIAPNNNAFVIFKSNSDLSGGAISLTDEMAIDSKLDNGNISTGQVTSSGNMLPLYISLDPY